MTTKIKAGVIAAGAVDANALSDNSITIAHLNCSDGTSGQVLSTDGSGTLSFADGGVAGIVSSADATAITIDSSENVGIGTTNPSTKLTVKNDSASTSFGANNIITIQNANTTDNSRMGLAFTGNTNIGGGLAIVEAQSYDQSAGHTSLNFSVYSGSWHNDMMVLKAGNVGIGTTSPSAYTGYATLALNGTNGGVLEFKKGDTQMSYIANAGDPQLQFVTNGGERMRIDSSGNVGINETSPDFSGFGSNGGGLELDDVGSSFTAVKVSQGSTGNLYLAASTGAGYLWQHSNSPLIIGTNNAERIRIQDGTGRTGINSPGIAYASAEKLSLQNDDFGFGIKTSGAPMGMWHTGSSGTFVGFAYGGSGAGAGNITFSGASVSYNSNSDYRLKENVDYTWDATTRLKQLKPARFNWISDETNTRVDGFLAHEVSSVVPEAVTGEKDAVYTAEEAQNVPNTAEGDAKIQALDNAKLVPLIVKAMQELEARITTLENA
jgi:hypothetical protein